MSTLLAEELRQRAYTSKIPDELLIRGAERLEYLQRRHDFLLGDIAERDRKAVESAAKIRSLELELHRRDKVRNLYVDELETRIAEIENPAPDATIGDTLPPFANALVAFVRKVHADAWSSGFKIGTTLAELSARRKLNGETNDG